MKKIFISFYLNQNLGDDLFVKILCEKYQKTKFYIYGDKKNKHTFDELKNLKYISSNFLLKFIDKISFKFLYKSIIRTLIGYLVDANVYIGGSLFMQDENWKKKIEIDRKMIMSNKPNFLIGCNFGPYETQSFLQSYKQILTRYNDVCFRDNKSYKLFNDLNNIRVAPDVVFNLKYPPSFKHNNNVGISIIDLSNRGKLKKYKEKYLKKLKSICEYYIEKEHSITLFSFCKNEGDEKAIKELLELFDLNIKRKINVVCYRDNLEYLLSELSKIDILFATRFHSMILGFLFGKKVIPIIYSEKMTNVLKDLNYSGSYCEIKDLDDFDINNINIDNNIAIYMDKIIKKSNEQFKVLDEFLKL
ncbi:polysaccharide pyruvyl transferase family protein [Terrilactibacillus laevilacticus]|uniref:Polysaccharide pyruvyl transferase family protein n=1 Tax=Terrilactibacillus laevilacticus TaxID=1380157 RepID=A0ABW5PLN8_9BACI|nr:polysaccharide pyruvyl transferase family protein [Terrilactibacillus laevilacticus]